MIIRLGNVNLERLPMSGITKRLITAIIVLPLLFVIIAFMPWLNYIAYCFIVLFATAVGSYEMNSILSKKGEMTWTGYLGLLLPIAEYIQEYMNLNFKLTLFTLIFIVIFTMAFEIFKGAKDNFKETISRVSKAILNIIYPGLFSIFLIRMAFIGEKTSNWYILFFLILVFGSDTCAYFTGMILGKRNRGFIKASPKKSIAGYIGGIIIPGVLGLVASLCFPKIFVFNLWEGFILGFITAIFAAIGDLIESTLKRSAEVKDSGIILPGRGGMLDSIDSIMIAAPVFILILDIYGVFHVF